MRKSVCGMKKMGAMAVRRGYICFSSSNLRAVLRPTPPLTPLKRDSKRSVCECEATGEGDRLLRSRSVSQSASLTRGRLDRPVNAEGQLVVSQPTQVQLLRRASGH